MGYLEYLVEVGIVIVVVVWLWHWNRERNRLRRCYTCGKVTKTKEFKKGKTWGRIHYDCSCGGEAEPTTK